MVKDAFRVGMVMMLDGAGYNYDVLTQRFEMIIAIWGAPQIVHSLVNFF